VPLSEEQKEPFFCAVHACRICGDSLAISHYGLCSLCQGVKDATTAADAISGLSPPALDAEEPDELGMVTMGTPVGLKRKHDDTPGETVPSSPKALRTE